MPFTEEGIRIEPPPSAPREIGHKPVGKCLNFQSETLLENNCTN